MFFVHTYVPSTVSFLWSFFLLSVLVKGLLQKIIHDFPFSLQSLLCSICCFLQSMQGKFEVSSSWNFRQRRQNCVSVAWRTPQKDTRFQQEERSLRKDQVRHHHSPHTLGKPFVPYLCLQAVNHTFSFVTLCDYHGYICLYHQTRYFEDRDDHLSVFIFSFFCMNPICTSGCTVHLTECVPKTHIE